MSGSATFTIVASRKIMKRPSPVATSVHAALRLCCAPRIRPRVGPRRRGASRSRGLGRGGAACSDMATRHLDLSRDQIVAFRRRAGGLDRRRPLGPGSLRAAAWAGLQDSMPRAALLSIHARVEGTTPTTWEDPPLVQLWGPRFSAYLVADQDRGIFTLGRLPDD